MFGALCEVQLHIKLCIHAFHSFFSAILCSWIAISYYYGSGEGVSLRVDECIHRMTTPYHPQANGLVERYNQTLCNSLAKFAQDDQESWDANLGPVVYAYNTAIQVYLLIHCIPNDLNLLLL